MNECPHIAVSTCYRRETICLTEDDERRLPRPGLAVKAEPPRLSWGDQASSSPAHQVGQLGNPHATKRRGKGEEWMSRRPAWRPERAAQIPCWRGHRTDDQGNSAKDPTQVVRRRASSSRADYNLYPSAATRPAHARGMAYGLKTRAVAACARRAGLCVVTPDISSMRCCSVHRPPPPPH